MDDNERWEMVLKNSVGGSVVVVITDISGDCKLIRN
jgi:hypothetical protein